MRDPIHPRNKLIVLARKIWQTTEDKDFSFRSLAKVFGISSETVVEINKRFKERYDFGIAFDDPRQKKKLSTDRR